MRLITMGTMAQDVRAGKVGKGEFMAYAAIFIAATVYLLAEIAGLVTSVQYDPAWLEIVDKTFLVGFTIATIIVAHVVNKRGDGQRFWYRFVSLSFPIAVVIGALALLAFLVLAMAGVVNAEVYGYIDLTVLTGFYILGLFFTAKYMRIAATGQ